MRPNNLSSYLTKLGSIITALADLINTFTLASYASIYFDTYAFLNSSLRKITQKRSAFPTDKSIYKILYLALTNASKKRTMPIRN